MNSLGLQAVDAVLILSNEGSASRLLTKYYSTWSDPSSLVSDSTSTNSTKKDHTAFEKGLLAKTAQKAGDVILYDNHIVVYKSIANLTIYIVGPAHENELLLLSVAVCLKEVLLGLFVTPNDQQTLDKQAILENYDLAALAVDEIIDQGVVLQTDRDAILSRISQKPQMEMPAIADLDLSEKTIVNVWKFARQAWKEGGF